MSVFLLLLAGFILGGTFVAVIIGIWILRNVKIWQ